MAKGRPPAPDAAKRGTAKRKPKAVTEALALPDELAISSASAPDDLAPDLVPVWDAIMEDLGARGASASAYRAVDCVVVRCLVDAIGTQKAATERINATGLLVKSRHGEPIVNPLVKVQKDASATILRLTDALGLNPAARVRLGVMQLAGQSILMSIQKMLEEQ